MLCFFSLSTSAGNCRSFRSNAWAMMSNTSWKSKDLFNFPVYMSGWEASLRSQHIDHQSRSPLYSPIWTAQTCTEAWGALSRRHLQEEREQFSTWRGNGRGVEGRTEEGEIKMPALLLGLWRLTLSSRRFSCTNKAPQSACAQITPTHMVNPQHSEANFSIKGQKTLISGATGGVNHSGAHLKCFSRCFYKRQQC